METQCVHYEVGTEFAYAHCLNQSSNDHCYWKCNRILRLWRMSVNSLHVASQHFKSQDSRCLAEMYTQDPRTALFSQTLHRHVSYSSVRWQHCRQTDLCPLARWSKWHWDRVCCLSVPFHQHTTITHITDVSPINRHLPYRTHCTSEPSSGLQSPPSRVQPSWH